MLFRSHPRLALHICIPPGTSIRFTSTPTHFHYGLAREERFRKSSWMNPNDTWSVSKRAGMCRLWMYITVLTTCVRDISILSTTDGSCQASAGAGSPVLVPPPGTVDHHTLHCAWTWKCVHLVKTQNVSVILAPLPNSPL